MHNLKLFGIFNSVHFNQTNFTHFFHTQSLIRVTNNIISKLQSTNLQPPDFLGELDALGVAQPPHVPQLVGPLYLQDVAQELNARLAAVERRRAHCESWFVN